MREPRSDKSAPAPWRVPVTLEDIAETGRHFDLVADADVRAALVRIAGLRDLPRLEAIFDVTRHDAGGVRVAGRVTATVGQNCVVTLEPLANVVEEAVDLVFAPQPSPERNAVAAAAPDQASAKAWSDQTPAAPEPLVGGVVDLGAVATKFLILGLDPYPRKPGAVFEPPQDIEPDGGPFADLARLTKAQDGH